MPFLLSTCNSYAPLNSQDKPEFWKSSWILPFLSLVKGARSFLLTTLTTCSPGQYLLITLFYHCSDHSSLFYWLECIVWGHGPFISRSLVLSLQHWVRSVCFCWTHGWVNSLGLNFQASFQIPFTSTFLFKERKVFLESIVLLGIQ